MNLSFDGFSDSCLYSHEHPCFTIYRAAHACRGLVADVNIPTQFTRPFSAFHLTGRVRPQSVLIRVQCNLGIALLGFAVVADLETTILVATHERLQPGPSICAFWPVVPWERVGFPPPLNVSGSVGNAVVSRVLWARDLVVGPN